jgi:hypothetical protein
MKVNIMQRLTIELTGEKALRALKDLEHKQMIRIVREPDLNSYTFPGKPISNEDFRRWVDYAEESPTVTLVEAKQRWTEQKKKLQKLIP